MARKDSEHQKTSMSLLFRGRDIFKPLNTGRIDERVSCVREWVANIFFYTKNGTTIMIDAGYNYPRLREKMGWLDIDPASIRHILITHQDTDHVGALERDSECLFRDAEVYIGETENRYLTGEVRRKVMHRMYKLPLVKNSIDILQKRFSENDRISIVTYAGNAGTVLEPTQAGEKDKILRAIDNLAPGGSTAGEAGIREAYRLAQKSFVKGGINRVMLATDGDFNVGQTDDDDLKQLIEKQRETGVFLSVFGFGRGNLNDQMMQTIAQNGNGTAAYIDTLAEAEKVLVEGASSTLFPIAKDVKIQVEFNPAKVSEYRLIGYETRALNREDFNNDRVDAGEIGSGHSVTAIYELTPKGTTQQVDDLRYGAATTSNGGVSNAEEYAFVKIRYKLPDADTSRLITTPVTGANEVPSFDAAGADQRFSVAVAAFGQKLRNEDATAKFGYDRIQEIANAARGADPFGYRAEFLSLVRLAAAMN